MESIPEDNFEAINREKLIEDLAYFKENSGFNPVAYEDKDPVEVFKEDLFWLGCRDIARLLRQDRDWLHINDGYEGTGKSNSSMWSCLFVDPLFYSRNLNKDTWLKDILFVANEILRSIKGSRYYEAKNLDEGSKALFAREAMKEKNIDLIKTFTLCRQQRQFFNINIPTIWILDPYLRNSRVKTWGHNFEEFEERGFIKLFRKNASMWKVDPWFDLRAEVILPKFDNELWDQYLIKKTEYNVQDNKGAIYQRNQSILNLVEAGVMNQKEIGDVFSMTQQNISQIVNKWKGGPQDDPDL